MRRQCVALLLGASFLSSAIAQVDKPSAYTAARRGMPMAAASVPAGIATPRRSSRAYPTARRSIRWRASTRRTATSCTCLVVLQARPFVERAAP